MDRPATEGLSLWELLWCLGIAGAVLALAAPSFGDLLLDSRRRADINAFVTAIQLARSEAAKRGEAVVLCKTRDGAVCGGDEIRYDTGWMVFANTDDERPPHRGPADPLLLRYQPASSGPITSNRRLYEFRAFGWRPLRAYRLVFMRLVGRVGVKYGIRTETKAAARAGPIDAAA